MYLGLLMNFVEIFLILYGSGVVCMDLVFVWLFSNLYYVTYEML
jgi:hypothetical protein